jgi:hypothetical protein
MGRAERIARPAGGDTRGVDEEHRRRITGGQQWSLKLVGPLIPRRQHTETMSQEANRHRSDTTIPALNIRALRRRGSVRPDTESSGADTRSRGFLPRLTGGGANFDLLYRKYSGIAIGAAGTKWTGANGFGVPGYDPKSILTKQMLDDPSQAIALLKAIAGRESGRGPQTKRWARQGHPINGNPSPLEDCSN